MKITTMWSLLIATLVVSSPVLAQKKNETSAALERQKAYGAMGQQNMEDAKTALKTAKEFIDLAAVHEETKGSEKTLWLKGEIYSMIASVGMSTQDMAFVSLIGEDGMDQAIAALKQGFSVAKKHKDDIIETVDRNRVQLNQYAGMLYNAEQYGAAAELYQGQAEFGECINMLDTVAIFNAALCYERAEMHAEAAPLYARLAEIDYRGTVCAVLASTCYRRSGNIEKARATVDAARQRHPSDRDLLLELVNTNIDAGDAAGAEAALNAAIATDPNNKQLHYTIGTIYIDLKENSKAETALNKALEIDPNYVDAQYQLGAHLVSWAGDLNAQAKQLPFGDPNYNKMISESEDIYKRALIPLEKYIAAYPKDKAVLTILFQIHRNLGNSEKALEYKRRADEAE